jgi:hypothetical protein
MDQLIPTPYSFIQSFFTVYALYRSEYLQFLYIVLQPFGLWTLFQVLNSIHSRTDSLDGGSVRRKAATSTQNKRTQISMPRVGLQPTTPVVQREKTVDELDREVTVIGFCI